MASKDERKSKPDDQEPRLSKGSIIFGLIMLIALVVFVVVHRSQAREFANLLERAEPVWLLVAAVMQIATYVCAGAIWQRVAHCARKPLPLRSLPRLAVIKLTVDQLMPSGGMAGNFVVARALRRLGFSASLATEALLVDILANYGSLALATAVAVVVLWLHNGVTFVLLALLGLFAVIIVVVPGGILLAIENRDWKPPAWLHKIKKVREFMDTVKHVQPRRVRDPWLLTQAALLHAGVLLLDGGTLWAVLRAMGSTTHVFVAFVAVVIATLAGTVSALPGGLGTFEAGSILVLTLLGTPMEAALTGTLLLRGLTLWLPLAPGVFLMQQEVKRPPRKQKSPVSHRGHREARAT